MKFFTCFKSATKLSMILTGLGTSTFLTQDVANAWAPKKAPLMTRWAADVRPLNALPEYPRPQLVRTNWLNLNGVWEYQPGAAADAAPVGKKLVGEILVPFPVESALSGVMEHHDRLWYRRTFTVPPKWKGQRVLLNFGAVDYESEVLVNGRSFGIHKGGYLPFSYDITSALKGNGPQELIVRVFDPTDLGGQPRGKQTLSPEGIMYTPTTGIWQTVWLEPVAATSIQNLKIVPDIDTENVNLKVNTSAVDSGLKTTVVIKVLDGKKVIATREAQPNADLSIPVPHPKLWSPDTPFLYDLQVALVQDGKTIDQVRSYFGMRKISLGEENGVKKMFLNNKFVFQMGPLDQGFWPDGLYTAPTDEALRSDIEMTKKLGFNMTRKHIKVEPARWYYWTDKLGLLVWQDMPSPNSYNRKNRIRPEIDKVEYRKQLKEMVETHSNIPSIVSWVVFNEGQAKHDVMPLVEMVKAIDPTRLVNRDSGDGFSKNEDVGDIDDAHAYPAPASPKPNPTQAVVCGEYGGIGYLLKGHAWKGDGWGYTSVQTPEDLEFMYADFMALNNQYRKEGMSAAVYTQITDVEGEINGLLTYDRILKVNADLIARINRFQTLAPTYTAVVPTSEQAPQTWKYTFTKPSDGWNQKQFDDSTWQQGTGGFGKDAPNAPHIGTAWSTNDIWLRRTFNPGTLTPEQISRLVIRNYHDDEVQVFINGILAYSGRGYVNQFENKSSSLEARNSLIPNGENTLAVHCSQNRGGQYIDVGIYDRQMPR